MADEGEPFRGVCTPETPSSDYWNDEKPLKLRKGHCVMLR